jgi:hypothetical protein
VDVDEARAHDLPGCVEGAGTVEIGADLADHAVGDGDVGSAAGRPRPVDNSSAFDHDICGHAAILARSQSTKQLAPEIAPGEQFGASSLVGLSM